MPNFKGGEVMPKLTEKQKRFCDEYVIDCNATRAYKIAYPNVKNDEVAAQAGSRMLRNVKVQSHISEQLEKIHNEKTADAQEVMEYLTSVLRGKSKSEIVVVEGEGDGCSSAKRLMKAPDEKERLKAAELLGKRFGIFVEKLEVNADAELNIKINYGDENEHNNTS